MCFPFLRACVHWLLPLLILNSLTLERPAWMHRRSCSGWVPSPYSNFHFGAPFFRPLPHVHYLCLPARRVLVSFTWMITPSIKQKPVNVGKEYTKSHCIGQKLIALVYSPGFRILVPIKIWRGGQGSERLPFASLESYHIPSGSYSGRVRLREVEAEAETSTQDLVYAFRWWSFGLMGHSVLAYCVFGRYSSF